MKEEFLQKLRDMRACPPALGWLVKQAEEQLAWDTCPDGTWMLWLLEKLSADTSSLTDIHPRNMGFAAYNSSIADYDKANNIDLEELEKKIKRSSGVEKMNAQKRLETVLETRVRVGQAAARIGYLKAAEGLADRIRMLYPKAPSL